jgi:hypothetical protein
MSDEPRNAAVSRSAPVEAKSEQARRVAYDVDAPAQQRWGDIEVRSCENGDVQVSITCNSQEKPNGKRVRREGIYIVISPEAWAHLCSVPLALPRIRAENWSW